MQTPEEVALSFTGECKPEAPGGNCAIHGTPLGAAKTCLRVLHLTELIRARDAEVRADERRKALAEVKDKALDHRKIITEGPLVSRLLVSHWCNEALLNPTEGEADE